MESGRFSDAFDFLTAAPEIGLEWRMDYGTTTATVLEPSWFLTKRPIEAASPHNPWRLTAVVAVAHAVFFLTLALAGWLR